MPRALSTPQLQLLAFATREVVECWSPLPQEVAGMEYTRLGQSGLQVSRIGLGCMSYGQAAAGMHQWTLDEDAAAPFFRQAVESGVTFWDTANVYQGGTSEEFVGRDMRTYTRREEIVVATKVSGKMHDGPGGSGLSRKAVLEQLDGSLRRLGTDYIDVYYIHRFDDQVPVEETMQILHDVVRAGKARYLGASSMLAWQFAKLQHAAMSNGWTTFSAMEDQYNVLKPRPGHRTDPLFTTGQGPSGAALGCADHPVIGRLGGQGIRPGKRQTGGRRHPQDRGHARRTDGADRPSLGAVQAGGVLPDCRCHQTQAPRGRGGGPGRQAHRGRDNRARGAVHRAGQLLVVTPHRPRPTCSATGLSFRKADFRSRTPEESTSGIGTTEPSPAEPHSRDDQACRTGH